MNIFYKKILITSLFFFLGLGIFAFTPKSLNAGTDYIAEGYFECGTHGFQQDKDCGSINTNFPSGRTDFTKAALSYQFLGHRHGGSRIDARVCLYSVGNTGECAWISKTGNQIGSEYGGQHPFNPLGEGSIFVDAFTGSSGFYMYRSASVEDAEVRINASASADYPEPVPPPDVEVTVSANMVNFNFVVKNQYNTAINSATVTISSDYGNGTVRTTDGNGFANFGVSMNRNIAYTVTAGGCAGVSGIQNSGPSGINIPIVLICSGATPPANPPAPLILCTDPTATNNGLAAPCIYSPLPTACIDNSTVVVTQPLPERMSPGQTASYTMRVTNTGQTWWADGTYYQFLKKSGNLSISPLYGHLPSDKTPGQVTDWTFTVTAPATLGSYVANMQMIHKSGYAYKLPSGSICAPSPASDTYFGEGESAFTNVANCPLPTSETRGVPCSAEPAPYGPGWRGSIFETRVKDPISCNWGSWVRPWSAATWCQRYYILNVTKAGTGTGTVTSNPGAVSCGTNCSEQYSSGSSVTLTPTANSGSSFAGWSGNCNASGQVTMNSDKTCTATFNLNPGVPTPDLKVSVVSWYTNIDGPIEIYDNAPYTLSWGAVANATTCTLDGSAAAISGGTRAGTANVLSRTHTLSCTNAIGQTAVDSIVITVPPVPLTFTYSCNASNNQAILNWTLAPGYTGGYVRLSPPFHVDVDSGYTTTVNINPGQTYNDVYIHTRANGSVFCPTCRAWSAAKPMATPVVCGTAPSVPSVDSVVINSAVVNPNNTNQYIIRISGTDLNGSNDVKYLEVLINRDGTNAGQHRGLLIWNTGAAEFAALESKSCGGGTGYIFASNYNPSYIHLDSCSVSNSGNTRTVSFNVRFDTTFTTPVTDNDMSGIVGDNSSQFSPWVNFNGFDLLSLAPSGTLSASSCTIATGASTCNSVLNWTTANRAPGATILLTKNNPNSNVSGAVSGTNVNSPVRFGPTTFLLFHNGTQLAEASVNTSCAVGSTWDSSTCVANTPQFEIEVSPQPIGGRVVSISLPGIDCGADCSNLYNQNTNITLQAIPSSSYWKFVRWTGACSGFNSLFTCTLNVDGDKTVGAVFTPRDFKYYEF